MKVISVSELSDHWSEATLWLELEGEVLLTQDAKPVAKLTKILPSPTRKPFSMEEHQAWQRGVFGDDEPKPWVDENLFQEREERPM